MAVSEHRKQVKNVQKRIYRAQDQGYVFSESFKKSINGLTTEELLKLTPDVVRSKAINAPKSTKTKEPKVNPVKANMPEPGKQSASATKTATKNISQATNKSAQPAKPKSTKTVAKPEPETVKRKPYTERKREELARIRNSIRKKEKRGYVFADTLKESLASWDTNRLRRFTEEKIVQAAKYKGSLNPTDKAISGMKARDIERSTRSKKGRDTQLGQRKEDEAYKGWAALRFFKDTIKNAVKSAFKGILEKRKVDTHKKWWEFWLVDPVAEELKKKGLRGEEFKKEREKILKEITEEVDRERAEKKWREETAEYEDFLRHKIETDKLWEEQERIDKELGRLKDGTPRPVAALPGPALPALPESDTNLPMISESDIIYQGLLDMIDELGTQGSAYLKEMLANEIARYGLEAVLKALSEMTPEQISDLQVAAKYKPNSDTAGSEVNRVLKNFGEAIKGAAFSLYEAKQIGMIQDEVDEEAPFWSETI